MSSFEYVMVLFSVIVGLAITTLVNGFVRALRRDTDLRPGLIHTLWVTALFGYVILFWVARWDLATLVTEWTPGLVLASLLVPVAVYGVAALLFPAAGEQVALDDYFIENRRVLYGANLLIVIGSLLSQHLLWGTNENPLAASPLSPLQWAFIPLYALLMWTPDRRIHLAVAVGLNVLFASVFLRPFLLIQ